MTCRPICVYEHVLYIGPMLDQLLNETDVLEAITLGRTRFRELLRAGDFPPPRQVSTCRVAWRTSDVQSWIDRRPIADAYSDAGETSRA